jgi:single-strand DNA-binding protein
LTADELSSFLVCLSSLIKINPKIKYNTQTTNKMVARFTLAVNRRKEGTDFINIVAWEKSAEFVSKYFKKGQQVAIVGRLQTRDYEDTQGKKHYVTEVITEETFFADSKKEEVIEDNGDDLPF